MASLYERLGGQAAIDAFVPALYERVLADDHIKGFFDGVNMENQRGMLNAFLTMGFGGPNNYSGKDLREGHKHLVAKGLNDSHFDTLGGHINALLKELNVPADVIADVMTTAESLRADVLNK